MRPERNADDARARSDEAVRRLRAESARRVAHQRRWSGFTSMCAMASLAGLFGVAALDAYDAREQHRADGAVAANEAALRQRTRADAAAADEAVRRAQTAAECAKRDAALEAIKMAAAHALRRTRTREDSLQARADAWTSEFAVIESATKAGCTEPVSLHDDL